MSEHLRRPTALVGALRLAVAEAQKPWRVHEGDFGPLYEVAFVVAGDRSLLCEIDARDPALLVFLVPYVGSTEGVALNARFGVPTCFPGRHLAIPERLAERVRMFFPALEMDSLPDDPMGAPPMSARYDSASVVWRNVRPQERRLADASQARPDARLWRGWMSRLKSLFGLNQRH